jgi:membrane-bound serine protease (ClpP class)
MAGRLARLVAGVAMIGVALTTQVAEAQATEEQVVRLELSGTVDPLVADYLEGGIARAQDQGAGCVLIVIDTPGGLDSSMRQITEAILNAQLPVITYVAPAGARAASAGAFILLSAPIAAMAPGTNVGAATPVGLSGGDLSNKIANDAAGYMRSIAETYERNVDIAESFVTDAESISAEEALSGGVIDLIAGTEQELLATVDGSTVTLGTGGTAVVVSSGPVVDEPMGSFVGFLHGLFDPNIAFLFFWLGLALIVLELLVPGHIFSGTIGTILLIIALLSFGLLPVRWIGIALLIFSVVAFVIEINAPGLGAWGIAGTVAVVLGGWFLYDRSSGAEVSPWLLVSVAAVMALFFGFIVAKVLKMRHLPPVQGPGAIVGHAGIVIGSGVDERGGMVRVNAEEWGAVAPGGLIPAGREVRVAGLDGLVLTVEPLDGEHVPAGGNAAPAEEGGAS